MWKKVKSLMKLPRRAMDPYFKLVNIYKILLKQSIELLGSRRKSHWPKYSGPDSLQLLFKNRLSRRKKILSMLI
jgi:hypothetical protein